MALREVFKKINYATTRIITQRYKIKRAIHISKYAFSLEDVYKNTTVDIINEDASVLMIDCYSPLGFTLNNGIHVFGPAVFFAKTVLHWNVASSADIDEDSLSLFTVLEPQLDFLVIGKGDKSSEVNPMVRKYLNMKRISFEMLPTEQAIALLNFMIAERRVVAGALIPPSLDKNNVKSEKEITELTDLGMKDLYEVEKGASDIMTPKEVQERFRQMYLGQQVNSSGQEDEKKRLLKQAEGDKSGDSKS